MQNWIIRYVENLKVRMVAADGRISIAQALEAELPTMTEASVWKLLEAADDLRRILELELGRRDDVDEAAREAAWRSWERYGSHADVAQALAGACNCEACLHGDGH